MPGSTLVPTDSGNVDVQAFQLALSDRLRSIADPIELLYAALEMVGQYLGVNRVGYCDIEDATGTLYYPVGWGDDVLPPLAGRLPMLQLLGAEYVAYFRQGRTAYVPDVDLDPMVLPGSFAAIGTRSFLAVPLVRDGVWVAGLFTNHAEVREWTLDEGRLLEGTLARTWESVERARAEYALRARTRERDRVWQHSQDMLGVANEHGVWMSVSPAWTRILGWQPEDIIGRTSEWMEHPEDREKTRAEVRNLAAGNSTFEFENRFRTVAGDYRSLTWTAVPDEGSLYCVARDVTDEKSRTAALAHAEEALRQSQKMEAVGQLTGGLAHDFNNLLAGISGSLELMQTRMQQGRFNDVERYMAAAQGASKRAAALTHRLLAFSRRQTLDPKPTDVTRLAMGMQEMIQRTVGPSIPIEVVGATTSWPALVDPSQLENALLNLCINARDAMPDGGSITIETANKWMDERAARQHDMPEGQYLSLSVTDTGTGMAPEVIARVFEPFFTTKPIGEGTGLGLSMIYGFAQQSGGQVRIYSEVGQGTTVCIYLPRHYGAVAVEKAEEKASELPRSEDGETVLVVDDEPTVRMLITDILEDLGYAAIEAGDSATGLKVLQSDVRIDLLITDVGLPGGMNGRQMADAARVTRADLKILFITGYAENALLGTGQLKPGMAVLTKPFAMDDMAARIRSMIVAGKVAPHQQPN